MVDTTKGMGLHQAEFEIPAVLLHPLKEGLGNVVGGEIIVRQGVETGRIYIYQGQIAWITSSNHHVRLSTVLREHAGLPPDQLNAAIEESRRVGENFGEILLEWGLIAEGDLRHCLLVHMAGHFRSLLTITEGAAAMFVPQGRVYKGSLLFSLDQVVSTFHGELNTAPPANKPKLISETPPPPKPPKRIQHMLGHILSQTPEADSAFLVDAEGVLHGAGTLFAEAAHARCIREFCESLLDGEPSRRLQDLGRGLDGEAGPPRELIAFATETLFLCYRGNTPGFWGVVCASPRNLGLVLGAARTALRDVADGTPPESQTESETNG